VWSNTFITSLAYLLAIPDVRESEILKGGFTVIKHLYEKYKEVKIWGHVIPIPEWVEWVTISKWGQMAGHEQPPHVVNDPAYPYWENLGKKYPVEEYTFKLEEGENWKDMRIFVAKDFCRHIPVSDEVTGK